MFSQPSLPHFEKPVDVRYADKKSADYVPEIQKPSIDTSIGFLDLLETIDSSPAEQLDVEAKKSTKTESQFNFERTASIPPELAQVMRVGYLNYYEAYNELSGVYGVNVVKSIIGMRDWQRIITKVTGEHGLNRDVTRVEAIQLLGIVFVLRGVEGYDEGRFIIEDTTNLFLGRSGYIIQRQGNDIIYSIPNRSPQNTSQRQTTETDFRIHYDSNTGRISGSFGTRTTTTTREGGNRSRTTTDVEIKW